MQKCAFISTFAYSNHQDSRAAIRRTAISLGISCRPSCLIFLLPDRFQPRDGRARQALGLGAEDRRQGRDQVVGYSMLLVFRKYGGKIA